MPAMTQTEIKAIADGDVVWSVLRYRYDGEVHIMHAGRLDAGPHSVGGEFGAPQLSRLGVSFAWDQLEANGFATEDWSLDLYDNEASARGAFETAVTEGARTYGEGWTTNFET